MRFCVMVFRCEFSSSTVATNPYVLIKFVRVLFCFISSSLSGRKSATTSTSGHILGEITRGSVRARLLDFLVFFSLVWISFVLVWISKKKFVRLGSPLWA